MPWVPWAGATLGAATGAITGAIAGAIANRQQAKVQAAAAAANAGAESAVPSAGSGSQTSSTGSTTGTEGNSRAQQVGGGHGPNSTHRETTNTYMDLLADSGDFDTVYGNRALSTAGLNGSQRPDIIAISNNADMPNIAIEFASPSQA